MDAPDLPAELLTAGREYLGSLRNLGLRPELFAWGYDFPGEKFFLFLVWPGIDRYGPLQLNKLLFAAYNASALPKAIDPFLVHCVSPKSSLARDIRSQLRNPKWEAIQTGRETSPGQVAAATEFRREWIYDRADKRSAVDVTRDWRRFTERVGALAA